MSERPSMRETACVRSLYVREMMVGMHEHAAASPGVSVMMRCLSVVTRRCAWVEWRRQRRQTKDKGRVAAIVVMGTAPGLHGGEREGRAVQRMRPPRARLRESNPVRKRQPWMLADPSDGQKVGWITDSERMGSPGGRVCETLRGLRSVFCSQSGRRRLRTGRAHVLAWGAPRSARFAF